MQRVRLVVVDDHALFRAGLISLLSQMPEFEVVGEAGDAREAIKVVGRAAPDVVLLDINMPGISGIEAVGEIKKLGSARVLMLTISKQDEDLFGAIAAGADGYLLKNAEPDELKRAIKNVAEGKAVLSPEVTTKVLKAVGKSQGYTYENQLSLREMEVLECLAQGKTSSQIAADLFITENTVKTHVRHILEKLEASNRAEAVSRAIQLGLIKQ